MKEKVTDTDIKTLQKIQRKLLGHELPKEISRDSLENTPLSELMNEYYQTYLTYFDEIRKEKARDKIGVDFVRGGFVGAFAPPVLEIIYKYTDKNNL